MFSLKHEIIVFSVLPRKLSRRRGGCGLEFTSKNLGHTHCHIKGIWMQKTWGPPTPKGPGENTGITTILSLYEETTGNIVYV